MTDTLKVHSKEWFSYSPLPGEVWKDMVSQSGYQISNYGRVRSVDRDILRRNGKKWHYKGRILKQMMGTTGYLYVMCYLQGERKVVVIHQEAAKVFIGDSKGREVDHINSIKTDNVISNLRYLTKKENVARANRGKERNHTLEKNTRAKTVVGYKDGKEVERFDCGKKLSLKYGLNYSTTRNRLQRDGVVVNGVLYKYDRVTHKPRKETR